MKKLITLNEEINRMKSLFDESRLYGNLVEQEEEVKVTSNSDNKDVKSSCVQGDCKNGEGIFVLSDKQVLIGTFKNGEFIKGKELDNGKIKEGTFGDNGLEGENCSITSIGKYDSSKKEIVVDRKTSFQKGKFWQDKLVNGTRTRYNQNDDDINNGTIIESGTFEDGKLRNGTLTKREEGKPDIVYEVVNGKRRETTFWDYDEVRKKGELEFEDLIYKRKDEAATKQNIQGDVDDVNISIKDDDAYEWMPKNKSVWFKSFDDLLDMDKKIYYLYKNHYNTKIGELNITTLPETPDVKLFAKFNVVSGLFNLDEKKIKEQIQKIIQRGQKTTGRVDKKSISKIKPIDIMGKNYRTGKKYLSGTISFIKTKDGVSTFKINNKKGDTILNINNNKVNDVYVDGFKKSLKQLHDEIKKITDKSPFDLNGEINVINDKKFTIG